MEQMQAEFLTEYDLYLWGEGTYLRAWEKMGAHPMELGGVKGVYFAVWAPNAEYVSVVGDFNGWDEGMNPLQPQGVSGIWAGFVPGAMVGSLYKYFLRSRYHGYCVQKADPFAFYFEIRPKTASIVWDIAGYTWADRDWMEKRWERNHPKAPISIYEVHLGSWRRVVEEGNRWLTYREMAHHLTDYVKDMGFTHVEFLPITEHPFDGSWGYQTVGYFAPTSRFGTPQDFMYLVDQLHQNDIGVILDWVPGHFPKDEHGLGYFDGTHLYEHADPRQGEHRDWGTFIYNYGRNEVRGFLLSNAQYWFEVYHIDGLRVDAVASMLYLDYSKKEGEWVPNRYGGRENLEAIEFLRRFNEIAYGNNNGIMTIAEESTAWPLVSRPTYLGGLGFGFKWNMGWMHDTLQYMSKDPIYRKFHHQNLTFGLLYAFHENFILPFSHDEVVHGKGSMLGKMPGDEWQRFANLRLLYGYMFCHPGKKLLFMGNEFGQYREWDHNTSLDWHLLEYPYHRGVMNWVRDLNHTLRKEPALHRHDFEPRGFEWIDCNDSNQSTLSLIRKGDRDEDTLVCVLNFTPVPRHQYKVGVPFHGFWREILNSDSLYYGGSGVGNMGGVMSKEEPWHGRSQHIEITLPPLGCVYFKLDA